MLTKIVFAIGCVSVSLSLAMCVYYARSKWLLGMALCAEKMVDSIDGIVTLVFSSNALATGGNHMDMSVASVLRLVIFVPGLIVTMHLWWITERIRKEQVASGIGGEIMDAQPQTVVELEELICSIRSDLDKHGHLDGS